MDYDNGVGYFSKDIFPLNTSQSDNFPIGNFTNVQFPMQELYEARRLEWGPIAAARTDWERSPFGKLPLGKIP